MNYLRENLYSIILGIIIGTLFSIVAYQSREIRHYKEAPKEIPKTNVIYYPQYEPIVQDSNHEVVDISFENDVPDIKESDLDLICKCVQAEAGNQPELGKRLVIDVILNRVDDVDFPNDIELVIYQPNQFAVVNNGSMDKCEITEEMKDLVISELSRRTSSDVFYFRAQRYSKYGNALIQVKDHYFSTK